MEVNIAGQSHAGPVVPA